MTFDFSPAAKVPCAILHIASSNGFDIGPIFADPYLVPPMVQTPGAPPVVGRPGMDGVAPPALGAGAVAVPPLVVPPLVVPPVLGAGVVAPPPLAGGVAPPIDAASNSRLEVPVPNVPPAVVHICWLNAVLPIGVLILPYLVPPIVQTPDVPPVEPPVPGNVIPGGGVNAFVAAGRPIAAAAVTPRIARVSFRVSVMVAFLMTRIGYRG